MRGSIRIGRILGIPVTVNPSWFVILLFFVSVLATQAYPELFPRQDAWVHWLLALATALVFFFSMVLHELGHSVVARYFDIPVHSITLFLLGAVAQTGRESRRASHEFVMAAAGPAVSILVAGVFMVLWFVSGEGESTFSKICAVLWINNIGVGLFNMIPAYPMDGGRVLRSALWGLTGNYRRATRWASLVGRGFALLMMGFGVLVLVQAPGGFDFNPINGMMFILLGLFIYYAAGQGDAQSGILELLGGVRAGDVMVRDVPVAVGGDTVHEALAGPLSGYGPGREWLMVSDDGRFAGLVPRTVLQSVPDSQWDRVQVRELVIPPGRLRATSPDEPLSEVLQRMDGERSPLFVVVENGNVAGVLHRGMIAAVLQRRQALAAAQNGHRGSGRG